MGVHYFRDLEGVGEHPCVLPWIHKNSLVFGWTWESTPTEWRRNDERDRRIIG